MFIRTSINLSNPSIELNRIESNRINAVAYLKTRNAAQVAFSKDRTARDIRETFAIPKEERPGPGTYDLGSTMAAPPKPPMQGLLGHNPSAADDHDVVQVGQLVIWSVIWSVGRSVGGSAFSCIFIEELISTTL